jgi:hypothetical protein
MNKQLESFLSEFLSTTSYDETPGDWRKVPAEDDNDEVDSDQG